MAVDFSRTLRSLRSDGFGFSSWLTLASIAVLGVWLAWLMLASVGVWAVSRAARLEVIRAPHRVAAPVGGRVIAVPSAAGDPVEAGELLLELEHAAEDLALAEGRARIAALVSELAGLRAAVRAERETITTAGHAGSEARRELQARLRAAEAAAGEALRERERLVELHAQGLISAAAAERATSTAQQRRADAAAVAAALERLHWQSATEAGDRQVRVHELEREALELAGSLDQARAGLARLEESLQLRFLRSPVSGTLAEVRSLSPGEVVNEGDWVATVVPAGALHVVAEFAPHEALGRIRPGQPGRLRLEGFPWIQYGTVPVVVSKVAGEVRDGAVRVELTAPEALHELPLEHGYPTSAEIQVERISPWRLILRAAGAAIDRRSTSSS